MQMSRNSLRCVKMNGKFVCFRCTSWPGLTVPCVKNWKQMNGWFLKNNVS